MTITLTARAALLDMDGTLVDSTSVVERLWLEWAAPHDLAPDHVLQVIHGRQGHQSMAIMLPERDHDINLAENIEMLAKESADVDGVIAIPGAATFLRSIASVPHAIVTSANVALMTARMTAAGLAIPTVQVTAESVTKSKPDPEGFLMAAEALGVAPGDCIVFEDSEAGIQAGRDAGMIVIGVGTHAAEFHPTHHVEDLTHVTVSPMGTGFTLTLR